MAPAFHQLCTISPYIVLFELLTLLNTHDCSIRVSHSFHASADIQAQAQV